MKIVTVSLLTLWPFVVAASAGGGAPGAGQPNVLGGTVDHNDPAVVMLNGRSKTGPGEDCSAFVVSPHVLVTAAHCVMPDAVGPDPTFSIYLGDSVYDTTQAANDKNTVKIKESHFDPLFDLNNSAFGHDWGVIVTETPLTIKPLPIQHTAPPDSMIGQTLRMVGYGRTMQDDPTSVGVRSSVSTKLDALDDSFVLDYDTTHTFCHGDSGGPELMMVNGVETVVGIVSARHRVAASDPLCGGQGRGTRIDLYADSVIQGYITANDPPPAMDAGVDAATSAPMQEGGCDVSGTRTRGTDLLPFALLLVALTLRRMSLSG
jgi:V8-like Glu-specific endopeptidase